MINKKILLDDLTSFTNYLDKNELDSYLILGIDASASHYFISYNFDKRAYNLLTVGDLTLLELKMKIVGASHDQLEATTALLAAAKGKLQ